MKIKTLPIGAIYDIEGLLENIYIEERQPGDIILTTKPLGGEFCAKHGYRLNLKPNRSMYYYLACKKDEIGEENAASVNDSIYFTVREARLRNEKTISYDTMSPNPDFTIVQGFKDDGQNLDASPINSSDKVVEYITDLDKMECEDSIEVYEYVKV